MKNFGVFIIAYNAEMHIEKTVARIPVEVWDKAQSIYMIDDCSTDESVAVASALEAKFPALKVLRNTVNRRYGGNQQLGYQHAIDLGLDAVVMLHGDGQYAPEMLMEMVRPILDGEADVVFGSRMQERGRALAGGMPRYKYYGNRLLTYIQNSVSGMTLSEFHSGYRAYSVEFLKSIPLHENSKEWHFDTQILLQAKRAGARIKEIAIPTYYGDEICHVNGVSYALHCVLEVLRYRLAGAGVMYSRIYDLQFTGSARYQSKFDDQGSIHAIIWERLRRFSLSGLKVLDVSVGDSNLGQRLSRSGAEVDVLALGPDHGASFSAYATYWTNDMNQLLAHTNDSSGYDVVLVPDVINYVANPELLLANLKHLCAKEGLLIVSAPNFANLYVRFNVLLGRLPWHTKGLLDCAQLHIFTRKSLHQLLTRTGWVVQETFATSIPLLIQFPFLKQRIWHWLPQIYFKVTGLMSSLLGYQFICMCRNPNRPPKGDAQS